MCPDVAGSEFENRAFHKRLQKRVLPVVRRQTDDSRLRAEISSYSMKQESSKTRPKHRCTHHYGYSTTRSGPWVSKSQSNGEDAPGSSSLNTYSILNATCKCLSAILWDAHPQNDLLKLRSLALHNCVYVTPSYCAATTVNLQSEKLCAWLH